MCSPSLYPWDPLESRGAIVRAKNYLVHVNLHLLKDSPLELSRKSVPEVRVKPPFPLPVEQLHPQTHQQQGPPSSPRPTVPELLTQTGISSVYKDTMAVFCKPKMSIHRLRLTNGDETLECLTSGLAQEVGKHWSLFLGSTTFSYYSTAPMILSAVRSHLINQHILETNVIKITLLNI